MNIYIGNLPYTVSDDELRDIFSEYGNVDSVNIIKDKFSGQSKGFGFVEMSDNSQADAAIKGLNETQIKGRTVKVNQARPKGERSFRGR